MYKFLCGHMCSHHIYLEVELLGHMLSLRVTVRGTARLFSKAVAPCCIMHFATVVYGDSDFSIFSSTLVNFYLFDYSHSSRYEVVPYCGSDLYFPDSQ